MRRSAVESLVSVAVAAYAVIAVAAQWWLSGAAGVLVALFLWRRHPRARFVAYIWLTVLATRGVVLGPWPVALFAVAMVLALQLPAAGAAWPRLEPGWRRRPQSRSDRMARP